MQSFPFPALPIFFKHRTARAARLPTGSDGKGEASTYEVAQEIFSQKCRRDPACLDYGTASRSEPGLTYYASGERQRFLFNTICRYQNSRVQFKIDFSFKFQNILSSLRRLTNVCRHFVIETHKQANKQTKMENGNIGDKMHFFPKII